MNPDCPVDIPLPINETENVSAVSTVNGKIKDELAACLAPSLEYVIVPVVEALVGADVKSLENLARLVAEGPSTEKLLDIISQNPIPK